MTTYITINQLKGYLKAMAILDIIILPREDSWLRIINSCNIPEGHKYVIDNGSGDNLVIMFTEQGALIKGFDHENELNQFAADEWDEDFLKYVYANVPDKLMKLLTEEEREETTFCIWCTDETDQWEQNETADNDGGASNLLEYIRQSAAEWCDWAEDYYEITLDLALVEKLYKHEPVTSSLIKALKPDGIIDEIFEEIAQLQ